MTNTNTNNNTNTHIPRKTYDAQFKVDAVKLITERGYTVVRASESLGVSKATLHQWKNQLLTNGDAKIAFPGKGRMNPIDDQLRKLERENRDLRIEKEILKKAMAYFANPKK